MLSVPGLPSRCDCLHKASPSLLLRYKAKDIQNPLQRNRYSPLLSLYNPLFIMPRPERRLTIDTDHSSSGRRRTTSASSTSSFSSTSSSSSRGRQLRDSAKRPWQLVSVVLHQDEAPKAPSGNRTPYPTPGRKNFDRV